MIDVIIGHSTVAPPGCNWGPEMTVLDMTEIHSYAYALELVKEITEGA
jgi:hypothetical protein